MKKIKLSSFILALFMWISLIPIPVQGDTMYLPSDPIPLSKTSIILSEKNLILDWLENSTHFTGTYHLTNPTNHKSSLKMYLKLPPEMLENENKEEDPSLENEILENENKPLLQIWLNDKEVPLKEYKKYRKHQGYSFDITLASQEKVDLKIEYTLPNIVLENKQVETGYLFQKNSLTNEDTITTLQLHFKEIHPGLIKEKLPPNYTIKNNYFIWKWEKDEAPENIMFSADTQSELNIWKDLLTEKENSILDTLLEKEEYSLSAYYLKQKGDYSDHDKSSAFYFGQAYYYEKAKDQNETKKLLKNLLDDDTKFSRVYWTLGNIYSDNKRYLEDLYEQVKKLHVHPLIQSWLAAQLNDDEIEYFQPEISTTNAIFEEMGKGLIIKTDITDDDGDIKEIELNYHWEKEEDILKEFTLTPYQYNYQLKHFVPAPKPLQRLYFKFTVKDEKDNTVTTGQKEAFYLNSQIPSETYNMLGANLVLGDYSAEEQTKVFKWFKSYLKMTKEAKFIPVEAQRPYLIFLGKSHDFIEQNDGPHFILYTPTPFSPDNAKIPVHRYFLSYLYGTGWQQLADDQIETLGDALLLGKGSLVLSLKYLQHIDSTGFNTLLTTVGEGVSWEKALFDVYNMTPNEIRFRSLWFTYGNFVIAFFIIIFLAWIGKKGYILTLVQRYKKKRV